MKRIASMIVLAALPAFAEAPSDFASHATIVPSGAEALQRFALPFEVYRDARRDLADVRVFNARGEPVPIALAAEPDTAQPPTVSGQLEPPRTRNPRSSIMLTAAPGERPDEFLYDLGASLPIEAVRLVPGGQNSITAFTIHARTGTSGEWTPIAIYRLVRDGSEVPATALEIGRHTAREWMARADQQAGSVGVTAPRIEVQWRDAEVVFVARGDGPFRLAFGDPEAKTAWMPVASLIPGYERGDEMKVSQAQLEAIVSGEEKPSLWPQWALRWGPRRLVLWSLLVIAVAVLGFMAWRLFRQMRTD